MHNEYLHEKITNRKDYIFHKGQSIIYQGEEASIINVRPVFIIKIKGTNQVICGDHLLDDVCPYKKNSFT